MPYTTGSQGAQTNPAKVFMESVLHAPLLAAGYTYVEEYISSTNTTRIYKSPAASNFFGQDWYLLVWRTADNSTGIIVSATEQYNSTTHLCFNYVPYNTGTAPTAQFAVNDATGRAPFSTSYIGFLGAVDSLSASGFNYYMSLTCDRVVIASRAGTTDAGCYVGLYDDFLPLAISPFPLMVTTLMQHPPGQGQRGAASREPGQTASHTYNFNAYITYTPPPNWTHLVAELYTQKSWLSRVVVSNSGRGNYYRGLLRDVWLSPVVGVNGDTLTATIGGVSRTLVQASRGGSAFFVDTAI